MKRESTPRHLGVPVPEGTRKALRRLHGSLGGDSAGKLLHCGRSTLESLCAGGPIPERTLTRVEAKLRELGQLEVR